MPFPGTIASIDGTLKYSNDTDSATVTANMQVVVSSFDWKDYCVLFLVSAIVSLAILNEQKESMFVSSFLDIKVKPVSKSGFYILAFLNYMKKYILLIFVVIITAMLIFGNDFERSCSRSYSGARLYDVRFIPSFLYKKTNRRSSEGSCFRK